LLTLVSREGKVSGRHCFCWLFFFLGTGEKGGLASGEKVQGIAHIKEDFGGRWRWVQAGLNVVGIEGTERQSVRLGQTSLAEAGAVNAACREENAINDVAVNYCTQCVLVGYG
jgi:hypothetical protein